MKKFVFRATKRQPRFGVEGSRHAFRSCFFRFYTSTPKDITAGAFDKYYESKMSCSSSLWRFHLKFIQEQNISLLFIVAFFLALAAKAPRLFYDSDAPMML